MYQKWTWLQDFKELCKICTLDSDLMVDSIFFFIWKFTNGGIESVQWIAGLFEGNQWQRKFEIEVAAQGLVLHADKILRVQLWQLDCRI